jgi:hypothetical protein
MKNKIEKNIHGVECVIEAYHLNGRLKARYEWNAKRTETFLVERHDESGKLIEKRIWNNSRTETLHATN